MQHAQPSIGIKQVIQQELEQPSYYYNYYCSFGSSNSELWLCKRILMKLLIPTLIVSCAYCKFCSLTLSPGKVVY